MFIFSLRFLRKFKLSKLFTVSTPYLDKANVYSDIIIVSKLVEFTIFSISYIF